MNNNIPCSLTGHESVLCFPAAIIEEWLPAFRVGGGILTDSLQIWALFHSAIMRSKELAFIPRDEAEKDPSWKQLIPYVVLTHGNDVFSYCRTKKSGEKRLHGNHSIGVGGHINPSDSKSGKVAYWAGVCRELREEVGLECGNGLAVRALIYDPSNEVGQVHFGVVHFHEVDLTQVKTREDSLAAGCFRDRGIIANDGLTDFENWSQLIIHNMFENPYKVDFERCGT